MPLNFNRYALVASLAVGYTVMAASPAHAQSKPTCASLVTDGTLPHPVYGNGGSAITADLGLVAAKLRGLASPISILFSDSGGACAQASTYVSGVVKTDFHYWAADGTEADCTAPLAGQATDFSHMGNPADACTTPAVTLPTDVKDFPAPIQTINIITGPQSSEQVVSADSLYVTYGFATLTPWTNTAHIVKRSATSFASLLVGAAIGVPGGAFKGDVTASTNKDVVTSVAAYAADNAQDGIGYTSGSAADQGGSSIKTLAFEAKGQISGFWPDSRPGAADKINVRTGQYDLWTPGHFFTKVDGSGNPVNADVANLIHWYDGTVKPPTGVDVVGLTIDSGDIPSCAMQVTRQGLFGAVSSWAPPAPCTHYFEKRATGTTPGTSCATDDDCKSVQGEHKCHYTYCEAY